jgi:DNA repair protein RadC
VLRSGKRGQGALELASELLAELGSLSALAGARPEELAAKCGIGIAKAAGIVAAFQLGLRVQKADGAAVLRSASDVADVAMRELAGLRRERVLVLVCDAANRLRRLVTVSEGSVDRSLVPVREILNAVLRHDGRAFALAHNHPAGDPAPSSADLEATAALAAAAKVVGVRFLDHVVVAGNRWASVSATAIRRKSG